MLGETTFRPYAINTFSGIGPRMLQPQIHYVHPHAVSSYRRKDGTFVKGYWRDGDGNTKINRATGYFARNPNALPLVFGKGGIL